MIVVVSGSGDDKMCEKFTQSRMVRNMCLLCRKEENFHIKILTMFEWHSLRVCVVVVNEKLTKNMKMCITSISVAISNK